MAFFGLKPDAPTPPNPYATAAAQTGTNVSTGIANQQMNQVNQVTPEGTLSYSQRGTYDYTDPSTGQKYSIPLSTMTQELSPMGKLIQAQTDQSRLGLATIGNQQVGEIGGMLNTPFNPQMNPMAYLQANPDVATAARASGMDPLQYAQQHYQNFGINEGRAGMSPQGGDASNIANMGQAQTNFFNPSQYLQQNPDVAAWAQQTGMDPAQAAQLHYQTFGMNEGRAMNNTDNVQTSLGDYGRAQSDFGFDAQTYLSQNPDVAAWAKQSGMSLADAARAHYNQFGMGENRQGSNSYGDITRNYGPADNFSADRQRVEDALMQRMNPQLGLERANIEQRLADQGIRYGSQAYSNAMDDYNRQATDARFAAVGQAGQEQQRMNAMAAQLAAFQNAAQGQAFGQAQGRGEFANAAQQQNYAQQLGAGSFANAAQNQQFGQNAQQAGFYNAGLGQQLAQQQSAFNAANAQRNQYMQEAYQQRNQPMNEITALMGGSQLQQPNWLNSPSSQIATTDIGGLINQNFAQQSQNYQSANQNWQTLMGGLMGMGAGALSNKNLVSDEREKENISRVGTVFAATPEDEKRELPIYQYSYKADPASMSHVGPMAQDVEKIDKRAVGKRKDGVKTINPRKVMGSILRAA